MSAILKPISALGFILCLVAMPQSSAVACKEALDVCINVLFPTLFPFFVLSDIFISSGGADFIGRYLRFIMKPLFRINGNGSVALVLGMISGYPLGAKVTNKLKASGKISDNEGKRLVCFCNNCGPMFIISALGTGMLSSKSAGIMLYIIHILSSITLGIILGRVGKRISVSSYMGKVCDREGSFSHAVEGAMAGVIRIFAFVIFFAVIMEITEQLGVFDITEKILERVGVKKSISTPIIQSVIEMTTGLKKLSASENALSHKLIVSSFVLGWSGLSVIFQSRSVSEELGISLGRYVIARFAHGCIGAIYTYIALKLPLLSQAVSSETSPAPSPTVLPRTGIVVTIILGGCYIISVLRSKGIHPGSARRQRATR